MKILYVSLYAEPLNLVPTLRTSAFCKYLPEFGIEIDVLTRYYDTTAIAGNHFNLSFSSISDNVQLPMVKGNVVYSDFSSNRSVINTFERLPRGLNIIYRILKKDVYHFGWIQPALDAFELKLKQNKYDYIIGSYSPMVSLQVAAILSKKYKIPWLAEFRDPYTDDSLESKRAGYIKRIIANSLLKTSSGIISVCEPVNDIVNRHGNTYIRTLPKVVVNNGVDVSLTEELQEKDKEVCDEINELKKKYFVMVHTGTIYPGQNMLFFIDFIEKFNQKYPSTPLILVCIGIAENTLEKSGLNNPVVKVFKKVDLRSSLFIQRIADVLVLPTWSIKVYSGFAAKVFEYIHTGNNVICGPGPTKDLEEFLLNFNNVFIAQNDKKTEEHLLKLIETRSVKVIEKNNSVLLFRKYWIEKLAKYLRGVENKSRT